MHCRHAPTNLQALYHVFVLPALAKPNFSVAAAAKSSCTNLRSLRQSPSTRPFSHSTSHLAKTRAAEIRPQKWNEEITARIIQLVDPETNSIQPPTTKFDVLNSLDQKTHRLVQVSPDEPKNPSFVPVCKIVSKKESYEHDKRRKEQAKAAKRATKMAGEVSMKTLELNWAIDQHNDLLHRLQRLREFLAEGRRVEVVLAGKKRGRKASTEECENVLSKIYAAVGEVAGAKERDAMTGKLGGVTTLSFQGRPIGASPGGVKEDKGAKRGASEANVV